MTRTGCSEEVETEAWLSPWQSWRKVCEWQVTTLSVVPSLNGKGEGPDGDWQES